MAESQKLFLFLFLSFADCQTLFVCLQATDSVDLESAMAILQLGSHNHGHRRMGSGRARREGTTSSHGATEMVCSAAVLPEKRRSGRCADRVLGTAASDEAQDGRRDEMVSFAKSRRAAWLAFLKSARLSAVGLDPSRHDSSTLREFQTSQHVEGEERGHGDACFGRHS